jgi:hypothetical protein
MSRLKCIDITGTTNEEIWKEVRLAYGPVPIYASPTDTTPSYLPHEVLMNSDIAEYNNYISIYGASVSFDKWLIWFIETGSSVYGNLRENKKNDHVGHCYAPCPYDTESSDLRSTHMLGSVPSKVLHELGGVHYYLRTNARGNHWGYECTFPGCPFYVAHGEAYFYV